MAEGARGAKLTAMTTRHVTIGLDLDLEGDQLSGTATSDSGAQRAFTGWLGLIAALDALVADPSGGSDTNHDDTTQESSP